MTLIGRCIPLNEKAAIRLIIVYFLAMGFELEKVGAFLFRSHNLPRFSLTAQTRYTADNTSSLKVTKEGSVVPVTDSNYRELFGGEKPLLLDAFAPW